MQHRTNKLLHGDHKPGKPALVRDLYKHGKLREFSTTSQKILTNKILSV